MFGIGVIDTPVVQVFLELVGPGPAVANSVGGQEADGFVESGQGSVFRIGEYGDAQAVGVGGPVVAPVLDFYEEMEVKSRVELRVRGDNHRVFSVEVDLLWNWV